MKSAAVVLKGAWNDSIHTLKSPRFISALAMVVCLTLTIISGVDSVIDMVGEKITIWVVPHIFDSKYYATFYGLIIIYLFSDVPFFNQQELYYMLRLGRGKWVAKKLMFIVGISVIFTVCSFGICILSFVPDIGIYEDWGRVIRTIAFGSIKANLTWRMSQNIIYTYTPMQAMWTCFLMVTGITIMTGFLMFAISIVMSRNFAVMVPGFIALLNFSNALYITEEWLPKINIFAWYRISLFNTRFSTIRFYPDISYCRNVVLAIIAVSIIAVALKVNRVDFDWSSKEG